MGAHIACEMSDSPIWLTDTHPESGPLQTQQPRPARKWQSEIA
jgi:hypothetical protein